MSREYQSLTGFINETGSQDFSLPAEFLIETAETEVDARKRGAMNIATP